MMLIILHTEPCGDAQRLDLNRWRSMRYTKGHKAETRRQIVEAAASEIRRRGIAATGIAALMARVGLTHGGFYAHFRSKEALIEEALAEGLRQTAEMLEKAARDAPFEGGLEAIFDAYFSLSHRSHPEAGCVLAALGGEIARRAAPQRRRLQPHLERLISVLARFAPAGPAGVRADCALAIMASMIGGIVMARIAADDAVAERILHAVKSLAFGPRVDQPSSARRGCE